jgi:hypothetical protein
MVSKIVSGGQTGVDRAALDAAIRLGIAYGGWVPKGRLAEDGPLPETYRMRETASAAYSERTERNVIDSDGTLIISRGELTGGSEATREAAIRHERPWLHVDLNRTSAFLSAVRITDWLRDHGIRILNVAGPRASKDPRIYQDTLALLESVFFLSQAPAAGTDEAVYEAAAVAKGLPENLRQAVERLIEDVPFKDRVILANMSESELPALNRTLGEHIINTYGLGGGGNPALLRSLRWAGRRALKDETDAAAVIIRELWKRLRATHALRRVK